MALEHFFVGGWPQSALQLEAEQFAASKKGQKLAKKQWPSASLTTSNISTSRSASAFALLTMVALAMLGGSAQSTLVTVKIAVEKFGRQRWSSK